MTRVLGLVNLHTSKEIGPITKNRSTATLTFLGRYAFVDIPLSNFANSNINTVGILVNKAPRSMIKHMDNAMSYTNNTKLGKTIICYNEQYANNSLYNTDINNIIENKWLMRESKAKYVVVAPAHIIYELDFNAIIDEHIKNNQEVTCLYIKNQNGKNEYIDQDIFKINSYGTLANIEKNLGVNEDINVSLETYIFSIEKLNNLLNLSTKTSKFFNLRDIINFIAPNEKVHLAEYKGYARMIKSMQDYLNISLELLDVNVLNQLFRPDWPIYTKTHDTPPATYLSEAWVRNSFISNGVQIDGKVENSVICRDVTIEKGCHIQNSIILSGSTIEHDAILEYVIVDKGAQIKFVKELRGTKENPVYVGQGDIV